MRLKLKGGKSRSANYIEVMLLINEYRIVTDNISEIENIIKDLSKQSEKVSEFSILYLNISNQIDELFEILIEERSEKDILANRIRVLMLILPEDELEHINFIL